LFDTDIMTRGWDIACDLRHSKFSDPNPTSGTLGDGLPDAK
jgi:hypothetical protein